MDPLTQGLLGAAAAHAVFGRRLGTRAMLVGAVAGVIPDADVFIRSASDPLLAIEVHRQFTHSFAFIPVGGIVAALPWLARRANRDAWKPILGASIAGYATHGLLDACTTYGTQLFWPFSRLRVAFHAISIIDPVFTIALVVGLVLAALRKSPRPAAVALAVCLAYLATGAVQKGRALDVQERVAVSRQHEITRGAVFPTVGNQLVWRSLYQSGGTLHADRLRVPPLGEPTFVPGMSVPLTEESSLSPDESENERVVRDFRRFRWFSDGWLARDAGDPSVIGDVRYSMRTDAFEAIWGVRFHPDRAIPTEWVDLSRQRRIRTGDLWGEITGRNARYREIPAAPQ
jgi:inner membrane protein